MFAVALFAPAGMSVGYPDEFQFGLVAVTWTYAYGGFWAGFRFYDPAMWVMTLPFMGFRYWLSYEMTRYYRGEVSRRRLKLAAIACEAPFALMGVVSIFNIILYSSSNLAGPTLILPVVALLLLRMKPPPARPVSWVDEEKESWWDRSDPELRESLSE
jgi:hypothetical protein